MNEPHVITARPPRLDAEATTSFEVEIGFGGTFLKGYRETWIDPGQPDSFEDIEITSFGGLKYVRDIPRPGYSAGRFVTVDFLAGVDRKNPEVQKLLENIHAFVGEDEMNTALLAEAA